MAVCTRQCTRLHVAQAASLNQTMDNLQSSNYDTTAPKHPTEIELIRYTLTEVINDAMTDFLMLTTTLKEFTRLASGADQKEASSRLSEAVKSLQSMDAFIQKLHHMIKVNEMVTCNESSIPGAGRGWGWSIDQSLILKLNHFQAIAASHDFASIVSSLKQNLNRFQAQIMNVSTVAFSNSNYFKHNDIIETKLDLIATELKELSVKWISGVSETDGETEERLRQIQKLYSIESERFVTEWLVNNPQGTDTQLMSAYRDRFDAKQEADIVENTIELF